jgi:hypothetical protein
MMVSGHSLATHTYDSYDSSYGHRVRLALAQSWKSPESGHPGPAVLMGYAVTRELIALLGQYR